ncbi:hypothetical protein IWZ01DRAFT_155901 [Phyllosticta capitalensis]
MQGTPRRRLREPNHLIHHLALASSPITAASLSAPGPPRPLQCPPAQRKQSRRPLTTTTPPSVNSTPSIRHDHHRRRRFFFLLNLPLPATPPVTASVSIWSLVQPLCSAPPFPTLLGAHRLTPDPRTPLPQTTRRRCSPGAPSSFFQLQSTFWSPLLVIPRIAVLSLYMSIACAAASRDSLTLGSTPVTSNLNHRSTSVPQTLSFIPPHRFASHRRSPPTKARSETRLQPRTFWLLGAFRSSMLDT